MANRSRVYKIPCNPDEAENLIASAIDVVVTRKNCKFTKDEGFSERIKRIAEWMVNYPYKWLFMQGLVGTGKSTAADALALMINSASFKDRRGDFVKVKRIRAKELVNVSNEDIEDLKKTEILIIDDFGNENHSYNLYGNARDVSTEIIEARYDMRKLTIFTSNFPFTAVLDRYGERVYDRMREMVFIVPFINKSYRHE